jgi:D-alanyl-lipoteichoic acid acyltransferase DltB (MBOAT superfamily)
MYLGADNSKIKVLVLILFYSYIYSMNQSQIFPSIMWHNWRQRCTFCVHCMFICKIDVVRVFEYVIKQEDCAFQNIEENRFRFSNQFIPKKIVLFTYKHTKNTKCTSLTSVMSDDKRKDLWLVHRIYIREE